LYAARMLNLQNSISVALAERIDWRLATSTNPCVQFTTIIANNVGRCRICHCHNL